MTAVASPPSFANISRPAWGLNGGATLQPMNPHSSEDGRSMFTPRKTLQRTNSTSSVSSNSSTSSTTTVVPLNGQVNGASALASADVAGWNNRKRGQPKAGGQWAQPQPVLKPEGPDYSRMPVSRPVQSGANGASALQSASMALSQNGPQGRPMGEPGQPVLYLLSLNGTFERKTISVPFFPDTLRIGRQTNARTLPTPVNGYFDSKVLSRQHAEIYADRAGKIFIRDVKSSNGTFVNGTRLSQENRESEPHELQTQDHLELGIDIVSEDQKSVMHHKVAAKVEHAGFLNPSHSLMDMNFGDLDPAGGQMMLPSMSGMQGRGRTGSQASGTTNGRMVAASGMAAVAQSNGVMHGRGVWLSQPSTEAIVKKLHQEMRAAKLQANDLQRTAHFLSAITSKEDVKNLDRLDGHEPAKQSQQQPQTQPQPQQHVINGGAFRSEVAKNRFSDPPAPPPKQPLPEKPDGARPNGDIPSLKRGTTERPRSHTSNTTSPIRQDNLSQMIQLTETLTVRQKEIEHQVARIRDLEEMVQKEREARESAEGLVRKLEDAAVVVQSNGSLAKGEVQETLLAEAFEPRADAAAGSIATSVPADGDKPPVKEVAPESIPKTSEPSSATSEATVHPATTLQARLDGIMREMQDLKDQLITERQRAEKAEAERDTDRRTLADMVAQIRQRDEEIKRLATTRKSRSRSAAGSRTDRANMSIGSARGSGGNGSDDRVVGAFPETPTTLANGAAVEAGVDAADDLHGEAPTVEKAEESSGGAELVEGQATPSRANTITPASSTALAAPHAGRHPDSAVVQAAPYATMIGVVLLGMGLMAWVNGWQPQSRLDR